MSSTFPVLFVLGSGANIGKHVAQAFAAKGYKVALASRSLKEENSTPDQLHISTDLAHPDSVISAFSKVKETFGVPSVVVYNGKCISHSSITADWMTSKLRQQPPMTRRIHCLFL